MELFTFSCCEDAQVQTLSLVLGFTFVFLMLWSSQILSPLKHLAVYFHELSHAMAAISTGGKVHGMEVHYSSGEHGGGVTTHSGGIACIVTPAGYIGCGLWGMAMIIGAANETGTLVVVVLMAVMFLWGLCQAQNGFMRVLLLAFLALFVGLWCVQHFLRVMILSDGKLKKKGNHATSPLIQIPFTSDPCDWNIHRPRCILQCLARLTPPGRQ
jgi:hypothetical protein